MLQDLGFPKMPHGHLLLLPARGRDQGQRMSSVVAGGAAEHMTKEGVTLAGHLLRLPFLKRPPCIPLARTVQPAS